MQKFTAALAIATGASASTYRGAHDHFDVYEHKPQYGRKFDRYGNPTDFKTGAVEYFGADGRSYGVGESVDTTTHGPNGVSSSTVVSYSSSTSNSFNPPAFGGFGFGHGAGHAHGGYGHGHNASGNAEDILNDIFSESFGDFGGLGSIHNHGLSGGLKTRSFGGYGSRPGYAARRPGYGGYERREYRPRPYGAYSEPKRSYGYDDYKPAGYSSRSYGYEEAKRPYGYGAPKSYGYREPERAYRRPEARVSYRHEEPKNHYNKRW